MYREISSYRSPRYRFTRSSPSSRSFFFFFFFLILGEEANNFPSRCFPFLELRIREDEAIVRRFSLNIVVVACLQTSRLNNPDGWHRWFQRAQGHGRRSKCQPRFFSPDSCRSPPDCAAVSSFFLRIFTNRLMQFYWIKFRTDLSVRSIAWERGWFIDRRVYRLHRFREGEQVGSQRVGFETERNRFGSSVFNPLRFPSSRANKTRLNNCLEQAGWLISPFRAEIERVWRRRSSLIDRFSASLSI